MMFSTKAEYGVRVMIHLARQASETDADADGVPCSLAHIAEAEHLPYAYLEHLAASLKRSGLIESRRGARGGYLLARPASTISMAEVVEALEGQIAPIECITEGADGHLVCTREAETDHICPTKLLWTRVQGSIVRTLKEVALSDLVRDRPKAPLKRVPGSEPADPVAA